MIHTYTTNGETWVDIDHGTPEEIHSIMDTYKIHPFIARELTSTTQKARIEFHDGYMYCILHFPAFKHTHSEEMNQEVDFVIGKNILITARYDTIDALHKFGKALEVEEVTGREPSEYIHHSMFSNMLKELYASVFEELEYIEEMTEDITEHIFNGNERDMVISISEVIRTLLDFKRVTDLHREILEALRHRGEEFFGQEFEHDMDSLLLDYQKINTTVHANLELLRELRDTNDSLLTTKQNETIKQLTVVGTILLPLNFIAVFFAMRFDDLPLVAMPNGFEMVAVLMLASVVISLVIARHKKWI